MGKDQTPDRSILIRKVDHTYVHNPVYYMITIRQMPARVAMIQLETLSLRVPSANPHAGDTRVTRAAVRVEKLSTVCEVESS